MRNAYRLLFAPEGTLLERLSDVEEQFKENSVVMEIVAFIRSESSRSLSTPKFSGDAS